MEKFTFDIVGKTSIAVSFLFNIIEWQSLNILFTCIVSLLSIIYIILKILLFSIDYKIKREGMKKEKGHLITKDKRFIKKD